MTKEQKNEVRNYFLAKKLPVDLMMEVEDHKRYPSFCLSDFGKFIFYSSNVLILDF